MLSSRKAQPMHHKNQPSFSTILGLGLKTAPRPDQSLDTSVRWIQFQRSLQHPQCFRACSPAQEQLREGCLAWNVIGVAMNSLAVAHQSLVVSSQGDIGVPEI